MGLAHDSPEFRLVKLGYISASRKTLPEKAIGIFIATALPRILRITKTDIDIRGHGEFSIPRRF
jgi:hypothetical protein